MAPWASGTENDFCAPEYGTSLSRETIMQASLQPKNSSNKRSHEFAGNQVKIASMHYSILTTNNARNVWKLVKRIEVSKLGTKC